MPSSEYADWPEDLAAHARIAADAAHVVEVRRQALCALATAARDDERAEETREQTLCLLAGIVGDEHQPGEIREEAFIGLQSVIRLTAGLVPQAFSGQLGTDLLQEAESYIWERL